MSVDYLAASSPPEPKAGLPLTPNSTAGDAAGLVEVLKLITDPAAHQTVLAERQQIKAAWAEIARERLELRRERALQRQELARLRQEFDAALSIDKENHLSALRQREQKFAAMVAEYEQLMGRFATATGRQHEVTS